MNCISQKKYTLIEKKKTGREFVYDYDDISDIESYIRNYYKNEKIEFTRENNKVDAFANNVIICQITGLNEYEYTRLKKHFSYINEYYDITGNDTKNYESKTYTVSRDTYTNRYTPTYKNTNYAYKSKYKMCEVYECDNCGGEDCRDECVNGYYGY